MSKGKLYDQIGHREYFESEVGRIYTSAILEILDEAAKEFPMTEQQIRILTDGPIYESDLGSAGIADPQDVAKWFKKYFLGNTIASIQVAGGCAGHIDMGKMQDIEKEP
jgi:hypothetical protein